MLHLLHAALKQSLEEVDDLQLTDLAPKMSHIILELEARGHITPSATGYAKKLYREVYEFAAERDMVKSDYYRAKA